MTQEKGIPYQRHKPSAALREFLDPLDPGSYFDCGRARLRGLDDALLAEARSRGRAIGDDSFQLVATDMGVIYCRPSISFAIAARWAEVTVARPRGDDPVVLAVTWPTHGELKFTVSKRLAGNVFRRWLQLRMQADRLERAAAADLELSEASSAVPAGDMSAATSEPSLVPLAQRPTKRELSSVDREIPSVERTTPAAEIATPAVELTAPAADGAEQVVQGKDRVAATVAEAASVVVNRERPATAKVQVAGRSEKPGAEVDSSGPETWEVVAKVAAPVRREPDQERKPNKLDRRQNPDALRRKRQEKAGDSRRRRRPTQSDPSPSSRSRWFSDLDSVSGSSVPTYDIPPLQSPDPSRPMRPAVTVASPPELRSDASPDGSLPSSTTSDLPTGGAAIPAAELVDQLLVPESKPKTYRGPSAMPRALRAKPATSGSERAARAGRARRSEAIDQAVAEAGVFGTEPSPPMKPATAKSSTIEPSITGPSEPKTAEPVVEPPPVAESLAEPVATEPATGTSAPAEPVVPTAAERQSRRVAAITGENRTPAGEPSLPVLLGPQNPPPPSWIGSPVSLVAAMVVISTLVLIGAVALGSYRRSAEVAADISPAGPAVSIIDHQRFRQDVADRPTASELGRPEASRYSETTAPPSTIGSGSAPIAAKPAWPPADGPQTCNSNYSGCVPDVGDVDCPNDGDGPIYWSESAMVMGEDVYELDTDGDGEICEPDQPPLVGPTGGPEATEEAGSGAGALSPAADG